MSEKDQPVFYSPPDGFVGDVIPVRHGGGFWLYYLLDRHPGEGTPWRLARTRDFVTFTDAGIGLPNGDAAADDFNAYTGSVVEANGAHHVFYTGLNPKLLDEATGLPLQVVMHAVSHDGMATWDKQPQDTFSAPGDRYDPADWRDPFVFRPDPDGPWRMLVTGRGLAGPSRRRGLIAQCVSWDLRSWEVVEPFWDPALYIAHECPDVFRMGEWWYLVYSEFSERFSTRYRMSRGPLGPWRLPDEGDGSLDGRAFYAAKTAADERGTRYAVGWIPTRASESDDGEWEGSGNVGRDREVPMDPRRKLPATIAVFTTAPRRPALYPSRHGRTWVRAASTLVGHAAAVGASSCAVPPLGRDRDRRGNRCRRRRPSVG